MYELAAQNMETQRHAAYEDMKARAKVGGADEGSPAYWAWRDEQEGGPGRARTSLGIDGKTRFRNLQGRVRVGDIFGRLTVVKLLPGASKDHGHQQAVVECSCSFDRYTVRVAGLRSGRSTACGKHRKEALRLAEWGASASYTRVAAVDEDLNGHARPRASRAGDPLLLAVKEGDLRFVNRLDTDGETNGDEADRWLRSNDPVYGTVAAEPAIAEVDFGPMQDPIYPERAVVELSLAEIEALFKAARDKAKPAPWAPPAEGLQITVSTNRPDQSHYRRIT
jgi:hypothetical protein